MARSACLPGSPLWPHPRPPIALSVSLGAPSIAHDTRLRWAASSTRCSAVQGGHPGAHARAQSPPSHRTTARRRGLGGAGSRPGQPPCRARCGYPRVSARTGPWHCRFVDLRRCPREEERRGEESWRHPDPCGSPVPALCAGPAREPTRLAPAAASCLRVDTGRRPSLTKGLDPEHLGRSVVAFDRPETLAEWLGTAPLLQTGRPGKGSSPAWEAPALFLPRTLLSRVRNMPPLVTEWGAGGSSYKLRPAQITTVRNLEKSLAAGCPRAVPGGPRRPEPAGKAGRGGNSRTSSGCSCRRAGWPSAASPGLSPQLSPTCGESRPVHLAGQQLQVRRGVLRLTPLQQQSGRKRARGDPHHPAHVLDAQRPRAAR